MSGSEKQGPEVWKWAAGLLTAFIVGGGASTFISGAQIASIKKEQDSVRAELDVTQATQRSTIDLMKGDISEIKEMVARIDERTRRGQ